jgi:hypothetical protein
MCPLDKQCTQWLHCQSMCPPNIQNTLHCLQYTCIFLLHIRRKVRRSAPCIQHYTDNQPRIACQYILSWCLVDNLCIQWLLQHCCMCARGNENMHLSQVYSYKILFRTLCKQCLLLNRYLDILLGKTQFETLQYVRDSATRHRRACALRRVGSAAPCRGARK